MSRLSKKPRPSEPPLPAFDQHLRYRVQIAARFLDQSPATTWTDIKTGRLAAIREGKRTYVPGAAIAARCRAPNAAP